MEKTGAWVSVCGILSAMLAAVACGSDSGEPGNDQGIAGATSFAGGAGGKTPSTQQAGAPASIGQGGNGTGGLSTMPSSGEAGSGTSAATAGGGESGSSAGGTTMVVGGTASAAGGTASASGVTTNSTGGTTGAAGHAGVEVGGSAGVGGTSEAAGAAGCSPGSYDDDLNPSTACVTWTKCLPGQRILSPGTSTQNRTCSDCADGFVSTGENAASCRAWSDCPAGTFVSNAPSKTIDRSCADCGTGTFTASANQSACAPHVPCAAGTVQTSAGNSTGSPACSACTPGNYCAGAAAPSSPCEAGTWDHDHSPATACVAKTQCAANEYVTSEGDAITDRTCTRACTEMQCGTDHGISCGTCSKGGTCNTETNKCIPPWSLTSVDYSDRMMLGANNFGKMCAHLVTENYKIVWELVTCCVPGDCLQPLDDAMWITEYFKPGARVMLCHGNDYFICSNIVTISE